MSNLKPLFENTMIVLSLQHMCFIATVSVATSQNTFNATTPTEIFGHSQKNFWTASFGILANTLLVMLLTETLWHQPSVKSIEIIDIECVLLSFFSENFVSTKFHSWSNSTWPTYKGTWRHDSWPSTHSIYLLFLWSNQSESPLEESYQWVNEYIHFFLALPGWIFKSFSVGKIRKWVLQVCKM